MRWLTARTCARRPPVRYGRAIKTLVLLSLLFALLLALPAAAEAHNLTRDRAKGAAQKRANQIADRRTRITKVFRSNAPAGGHGTHAWSAEARWRRNGAPCYAELRVRFASRSGRVVVRVEEMICS